MENIFKKEGGGDHIVYTSMKLDEVVLSAVYARVCTAFF